MTRQQAAWNPADHDYTIPGVVTEEDVAWMDEQVRLYRLGRFGAPHIYSKDQSTALALQLGLQHRCPRLRVNLSWPEPMTVQQLVDRRGWGKTYDIAASKDNPSFGESALDSIMEYFNQRDKDPTSPYLQIPPTPYFQDEAAEGINFIAGNDKLAQHLKDHGYKLGQIIQLGPEEEF